MNSEGTIVTVLRAWDWKALPQNIHQIEKAYASKALEPRREGGCTMFRGSVYVPDATHVGWWSAESQLDRIEIAGNLGVCGSRPNNMKKTACPKAVSCSPSRNNADRIKI